MGFLTPPHPFLNVCPLKTVPSTIRTKGVNLNLLIRIFIGRNMILGDAIAI